MPIQDRDSNNDVLVTYTRGLDLSDSLQGAGGIGGLLARTDANGSTFYHNDGAGNITALMDGQEDIVARYMYGPFGKLVGQWGSLASANEMQFSSMPHDNFSGLSFYPFRAYEPNFQHWLNQDPIQELGGINLYRAINNNPWRYVDPFGLQSAEGEGEGRADGVTGPSLSQMAEENNGSLEEEAAKEEQLDASAEALSEEGLDPNGTYLGPQKPPPVQPETAEQFAEDTQRIGNELERDHELLNPKAEKKPAPQSRTCPPNGGKGPKHGGDVHNKMIDDYINNLSRAAENIRKNQQQVDENGNNVGNNRPDVQYDLDGVHYNVEFDNNPSSSYNHFSNIFDNDPDRHIDLTF